ncbi:MAG TPA: phage holin family protein [Candidatus Cybelea sp.]|nr:phage holin family protein [Candidatus Cybelea sp.]
MFQEEKVVHPYELRSRTANALLQRLYRDVASLVVEEVDLAKVEVAQRSGILARAAREFALSAAFGLLALGCLAACAIAVIAIVTAFWLAALTVGVLFIVAALAFRVAARRAVADATKPASSKVWAFLTSADTDGVTIAERESRVEWARRQVAQDVAALEQKTDLLAPIRDTALGLGSLGVAMSAIARSQSRDR